MSQTNAPYRLRQLYKKHQFNEKLDLEKLFNNLISLGYEQKISGSNFCNFITTQQKSKFYVCETCQPDYEYYMCSSCFDKQKHPGHVFAQVISEGFCDCGRKQSILPQYFCNNHKEYNLIKKCQYSQKEMHEFKDCMSYLVELILQQPKRIQYLNKFYQYLTYLNKNSIYYNRLTFQFIKSINKTANKPCFHLLFNDFQKYQQNNSKAKILIFCMVGDLQTKINFVKFLLWNNLFSTKPFQKQMLDLTTVQFLIEQGVRSSKLIQVLYSNNKKYPQLKKLILSYELKYLNSDQDNKKSINLLTFETISHLLLNYFRWFQDQTNKHSQKLKDQHSNQSQTLKISEQELEKQIKIALAIIDFISLFTYYQPKLSLQIKDYLVKKGTKVEILQKFVNFVLENLSKLKWDNPLHNIQKLNSLMILMKDFPSLIFKYWQITLANVPIEAMGEAIFNQVQCASLSQHVLLQKKYQVFKSQQKQYGHQRIKMPLPSDETLAYIFEKHLYENLVLPKQQLFEKFETEFVASAPVTRLLKQSCGLTQQDAFLYLKRRKIYKAGEQIKEEQAYIGECHLSIKIIQALANNEKLIEIIDEKWRKYVEHENNHEKQQKVVLSLYKALKMLVNAASKQNKFTSLLKELLENKDYSQIIQKEVNKQLQQLIQQKSGKDQRQKAYQNAMSIYNEQNNQKQQIKNANKQKQAKIIQNYQKINKKAQHTCCVCFKKQQKQNPIVLISNIQGRTGSSRVFGRNCATKMQLSTCFDCIHFDCFKQIQKNQNLSFNCPSCKTKSNCVIPLINQNIHIHHKLRKAIQHQLISILIKNSKKYDVESYFEIIFTSLVQSRGIGALLSYNLCNKQPSKSIQCNQKYFMSALQQCYKKATKQQKQEYINTIEKLINKINKCQSAQFKKIQILTAQSLKYFITQQNQKQKQQIMQNLISAKNTLTQTQYKIIQGYVMQSLEQKIDILTNQKIQNDQFRKNSMFSIIELDQKPLKLMLIINEKNCHKCKKQINASGSASRLCLICKQLICLPCVQLHSHQKHEQNIICLTIGRFQLMMNHLSEQLSSYPSILRNDIGISFIDLASFLDNLSNQKLLSLGLKFHYEQLKNILHDVLFK